MAVSAAEDGKPTARQGHSVLTVLGPFWFDAGGAKPRERISLLTARAIFINVVHSLDTDSFRKLYASFYGWKGAAIIRSG